MKLLSTTSNISDGNMAFRYGESSEVLGNRIRFLRRLNLLPENCVVMDSDHSGVVSVVKEASGPESSIAGDTLITQNPDLSLFLTTADCLPISLYNSETETIGLMHLSRHTFVLNLIEKTFITLKELGVKIPNLEVVIGPHIHHSSYCFPLPLKEEAAVLKSYLIKTETQVCLNLTQATTDALIKGGVQSEKITVSPIDTYTSLNHFSHRMSVTTDQPEGRLATVVSLLNS